MLCIDQALKAKHISFEYQGSDFDIITIFMAVVKDKNFKLTGEVYQAQWFSVEDTLKYIKPNSLAQHYLKEAICKIDRL